MQKDFDFIVIGGGIVGVSTALTLIRHFPTKTVAIIEKEAVLAAHQTGHNSGVIHAGVYYAPGSLKAQFCKQGLADTLAFCQQHHIAYEQCGKLLVATNDIEIKRMQALYERCQTNEIEVELIDKAQLKEREPNIKGLGAIFVPSTAIVNYQQVVKKMAEVFVDLGGIVLMAEQVTSITEHPNNITLTTNQHGKQARYQTDFLVACAGLQADRITKLQALPTDFQIVPFRGEYYQLPSNKQGLIQHLIYPIPDPDLPFLGVHLTKMIDGSITVGPNAVQGFSREGYKKFSFDRKDLCDMLLFSGYRKMLRENLRVGIKEFRNSVFKTGYLKEVQKYCPSLQATDLSPYPAGIRAQAVTDKGELIHDFLFVESNRSLHVCNAPSPAATSAIPIGTYIVDKVSEKLQSK